MSLTLEHQNGQTHAQLQGELTIFSVSKLQEDLLGLLQHEEVTLDLTELSELDGCGAQLLAILQIEAQRTGKKLVLFTHNPVFENTLQCLGITMCQSKKES